MANKPNPTKTKAESKGAPRARSDRKRATKGERLIQLLKAPSGRDIATLSSKLGWQPHSTRAALSRLGKAGYSIEKLPPNKNGGSRYRIISAPAGPAR